MAVRGGHAHLELETAVGAPEAGAVEMPLADVHQLDPLGAEEAEVTRVIGGSEARLRLQTIRGCPWSRPGRDERLVCESV